MTTSGRKDRSLRGLAGAGLLLAVLLGLSACDAAPMPAGGASEARAPGIYFHNDVVLFNAVGVGSNSR